MKFAVGWVFLDCWTSGGDNISTYNRGWKTVKTSSSHIRFMHTWQTLNTCVQMKKSSRYHSVHSLHPRFPLTDSRHRTGWRLKKNLERYKNQTSWAFFCEHLFILTCFHDIVLTSCDWARLKLLRSTNVWRTLTNSQPVWSPDRAGWWGTVDREIYTRVKYIFME